MKHANNLFLLLPVVILATMLVPTDALAPPLVHRACQRTPSSSAAAASPTQLHLAKKIQEKDFDIESVLAEAEAALEVANEALSSTDQPDVEEEIKVESFAMPTEKKELKKGPLFFVEDETSDVAVPQKQPSTSSSRSPDKTKPKSVKRQSVMKAVNQGFLSRKPAKKPSKTKSSDSRQSTRQTGPNPVVLDAVNQSFQAFGGAVTGAAKEAASSASKSISSVPGKVSDVFQKRVTETADQVKAIPNKLSDAARQKARETLESLEDVVSIPSKISTAAQLKVKETTDDIVNMPNRLSDAAKRKVSNVFGIRENIPTLTNWKQNSNGSITGEIGGSSSSNFREGETVTTAPIKFEFDVNGATLVETTSGTRYYLGKKAVEQQSFFGFFGKKSPEPPPASQLGAATAKYEAERKRQAADEKRKAAEKLRDALEEAAPRSTFSLAQFLGLQPRTSEVVEPSPPQKVATAPKGIPIISEWRQNVDGSISGLISGSSNFEEGEAVTTSPIVGTGIGGAVVQTRTGSQYYLSEKKASDEGGFLGLLGASFAPFLNKK